MSLVVCLQFHHRPVGEHIDCVGRRAVEPFFHHHRCFLAVVTPIHHWCTFVIGGGFQGMHHHILVTPDKRRFKVQGEVADEMDACRHLGHMPFECAVVRFACRAQRSQCGLTMSHIKPEAVETEHLDGSDFRIFAAIKHISGLYAIQRKVCLEADRHLPISCNISRVKLHVVLLASHQDECCKQYG